MKDLPHDGQQQMDARAASYQAASPPEGSSWARLGFRMRLLTLAWSQIGLA